MRAQLWLAAIREDIEAIARVVNPSLLAELSEHSLARDAPSAGSGSS